MSVAVECPDCGAHYHLHESVDASALHCPRCGQSLAAGHGATRRAADRSVGSSASEHLAVPLGAAVGAIGVVALGGAMIAVYTFVTGEAVITDFARLWDADVQINGTSYNPLQPLIVSLASMGLGATAVAMARSCLGSGGEVIRRALRTAALAIAAAWLVLFLWRSVDPGLFVHLKGSTLLRTPDRWRFNWPLLAFPLAAAGSGLAAAMLSRSSPRRPASWMPIAGISVGVATIVLMLWAFTSSPMRSLTQAIRAEQVRLQAQANGLGNEPIGPPTKTPPATASPPPPAAPRSPAPPTPTPPTAVSSPPAAPRSDPSGPPVPTPRVPPATPPPPVHPSPPAPLPTPPREQPAPPPRPDLPPRGPATPALPAELNDLAPLLLEAKVEVAPMRDGRLRLDVRHATDAGFALLPRVALPVASLMISDTQITRDRVKVIATMANVAEVQVISGMVEPPSSQGLARLGDLGRPVRGQFFKRFDDAALQHLATATNLRAVSFHDAAITDAGLAALAMLPQLEELRVQGQRLTPAVVATLAKCRALRELQLDEIADLSDDDLEPLTKGLPLERLVIYAAPGVTERSLETLARIPSLRMVTLARTSVPPSATGKRGAIRIVVSP